jgi:hypothetical protein
MFLSTRCGSKLIRGTSQAAMSLTPGKNVPWRIEMNVAQPLIVVGMILVSGAALAQSGASGRGAVSGDPAASSATPGTSPTTGSAMRPSPSGSGTSSSGGSDANGDHGLDKMPETNRSKIPLDQQHKPDNGK